MNNIEIREAEIRDLESILSLNLNLFEKEYDEFDKSLDREWTFSELGKKYFSDRILENDGFAWVAEREGKIIGYICCGIHPRICRIDAKHAELENMMISKDYQRIGIGKRLVEEFFDWCDKNDVKYITVTASAKNNNGIEFYKSLGFQDYEVTMQIERP